jgi:hypothetical protein
MNEEMLDRMAHLDRTAAAKNANRVLEAQERRCASRRTDALRRAGDGFGDHIDDNVEGAAA